MYGQTFGVEIEAAGITPEVLRRKFRETSCDRESYFGHGLYFRDLPNWSFIVKSDGSIGLGAEITTPPMTEDQLPNLKRIVDQIVAWGMKGTKNCGLHIHVGLEPQYNEWRRFQEFSELLLKNWKTILPKVRKAWQPLENRVHYCKLDFDRQQQMDDRYLAMNCTRRHNTIEFRLFNAHLQWRWICRAIRFSCGFMKVAKMGRLIEIESHGESVEDVLTRTLG